MVAERDALLLKLQWTGKDKDRLQKLEEELIQIKLTLESELRNKQTLMDENQRLKSEEGHWKNQYDGNQSLIRQYAADKEHLEMEKNSLRSDIEKLKNELRELEDRYKIQLTSIQNELREVIIVRQSMETELKKAREPPAVDASTLIFDGVRKSVTANQLLECGVLDKPTFNMLVNGHKTVPDVSLDKKINLKGSGAIAGVIVEGQNSLGSLNEPLYKMTFTEAKKENLLPPDSVDLLLDAQASTGHIIDPRANQKLTVEEACTQGVVDQEDKERLLAAEAAAVGYRCLGISKPLSVFQAMKKGLIDRTTTLRVLQAQESVGGILDPVLSVFLPKQAATDRYLLDEDIRHALSQKPELYLDPESEVGVTYMSMKRRCKVEPHTGLLLLPVSKKMDPSKLRFDGVRKPVTAKQLADCGVLDKLTLRDLEKGKLTVSEVSVETSVNLKGTGPIAGIIVGSHGKMSLSEAKKRNLLSEESADLLLEAQAATGHIIDPRHGQKLTVEEACASGLVDFRDRDRLLEAEAAAVGYQDPSTAKPLAVFEAMRKGLVDRKTGLRLLQAQESAGGILDPNLSVFLPRNKAIERSIIDEEICHALNTRPEYYLDPDTELYTSYGALRKKCNTESHTSLIFLPVAERKDPSTLMFMGVRKPVSAKELFECGVLNKPTFNQLVKGEKSVPTVSEEKMLYLKGTGPIAGVVVGRRGKMALSEAKKQNLLPEASADLLLDAQAATGHIIEPNTNQKLTVEEACARGVVDITDKDRLLAAEAAAVGYKHHSSAKPLSVFEAFKKGLVDRRTGLRLLQAQEAVGGILDPNRSVFLPKDNAIRHNLLDVDLSHALKQSPAFYLDPETELNVSYRALIERCLTEPHTGLQLLPISEKTDPSKLLFDGVRKDVTAQQLLDCGVLDRLTFDQLVKGEKNVSEVAIDKKLFLKGTGSIAGVAAGPFGKMSFTEAKKQKMMSPESADLLLEAQAATGHLIDPRTNGKMTVKEACANGVMDPEDEPKLLVAEAAAMGYLDPHSGTILSAGQAVNKGLLNKDTALRLLQAQQSVGGILDPTLSVFLPKDIAINRGIIDEDLYGALNRYPQCYLDPDSQQATTYLSLKTKCKIDPNSGFLLLPEPEKPLTVQGLRGHVSVIDLVEANLLERHDIDRVREGRLTKQQIESSLYSYLRGSTCIAGVYTDQAMPIYRAMKEGLLQPYSALELLEAQAASGFIVDPVNNLYLTVTDAYTRNLFGPEFKGNLQAAEKAVTGYKEAGTDKTISLFQAIERGLVDKGRGMRLLEAQIASGGVIDPEHGHRVNMDVAYRRGYFDEKMSKVLSVQSADYKGFLDPNTDENLTYAELKKRCITDKTTGLILLPILDESKKESTTKNTLRKRRVVIVDPETNRQMTIREAYDKGYIDSQTFLELAKQECEWEEITIVDPDGSTRFVIIDKKTEKKYDITELLEKRLISQSDLDRYRSQSITLNEFANIITKRTSAASAASSVTSVTSLSSSTSPVEFSSSSKTLETSGPLIIKSTSTSVRSRPSSPTLTTNSTAESTVTKQTTTITSVSQDSTDHHRTVSKVSITLATPFEAPGEQEPVGAIFDTENLQKISVTEALNCGLVDSVTAQRLLEAQACTGGIINPINGQKLGLQEASRLGIITEDMGSRLKPAQKAYFGFEDIKHKKKMSAAEAMKEMWLPYEAGQRFMEFQVVTGGLYDPEVKCRRTIQDALEMGWLDERTAHKLQDVAHHTKNLTCPKSKLKISYKEALDNCMVEQETGVKMLQASSVSSRGISSPYNVASAPGSSTGSRSGSRRSSRRSSVDLSSSLSHFSNFSSFLSPT